MARRYSLQWHRWCVTRLALMGLLAVGTANAQSIDLMQAYRFALDNDATIRAARAAADVQRERLPQAVAQLRPNVVFSASRNFNNLSRTSTNVLGRSQSLDEQYFSNNATLTLRQPIYRPALIAGVEQARAVVLDADATLKIQLQNLASRVAGAYLEALLAKDQLVLIVKQREVAEVQLDGARKSWKAGTSIRTDADEIQARLDLLRADELRARQSVDFTRRQLEVLTGASAADVTPMDPMKLVLQAPLPDDLDAWLNQAESQSPELTSLYARRDAARQEIERAKAGHLPTLDAVAQITRSASENVTTPSSSYTNRTVGIQINFPLYSGGGVTSAIRQSMAELTRIEETLEVTRRDLIVRVHKEFRGVVEGVQRVRALEQAVRSAEQVVFSNQRSYEAGTRTVVDVLNAQQQRQLALRDLAQARYEYLIARVRLAALSGADVEAELTLANKAMITSN